jgi:hypothetical protein
MSVLGIMAASLSEKAEVQVNESHREPIALFLCAVSPPGDGKSPTLKTAASPAARLGGCAARAPGGLQYPKPDDYRRQRPESFALGA